MRLGVGKWSEGFSDPRRDSQTNAGFPQETRQRFTEGERHRVTEPKTNGYPDRKGQGASKLRSMDRSALPECGRSAAQKLRGEGDGQATRSPGLPAHTPASGVPRRGKRMCGGVSALEGRRGAQPESLTSPRPEAESAKFAPRGHSSASPLGPEATRDPAGPARAA